MHSPTYLGVAQMVARYLGVVEAAGSSPVTQTNKNPRNFGHFPNLRGFLFCVLFFVQGTMRALFL